MAHEIERFEDREFDPMVEPRKSAAWINLITDAEKTFRTYQEKSDSIDKQFANLERLAQTGRDREFQLFWANIQVIGPSIYSRPPVPVVVPRFKERLPLSVTTSELLERVCVVMFETADIDGVMRQVRDDLTILGRGVTRLRYETKEESDASSERVCIEHVDRKDFLHDPAREWAEVDWVAFRAWLTREQLKERFTGVSLDGASFETRRDDKEHGSVGPLAKCGVWEIWCKSQHRVVWIAEGVEELLDEGEPHLKLDGFFPCPRPVYATVQRRSLIPVPDMVQYKDQLEEINEATARISALTEAIRVRGFYPNNGTEIADAVEQALKSYDNRQVLVPISNWAAFGSGGDVIIWLPIEVIATTVQALIEARKQLIDDVYQITGLSDIMRGSTSPSETLGAQELKSQYGSIRIRDRTDELVRMARDITRIGAEIISEHFGKKTLLDMSQMELPTDAQVAKAVKQLEDQGAQLAKQVQQAQSSPELQQQAQANPQQAQQLLQQAEQQAQQLQGQIEEAKATVTIDGVMKLLREQRLRPFVLEIETDSTIAPDENAQKQRATEYVTALSGLLGQAQIVQQIPQLAPVFSDVIKFVNSQFRAGREVQTTVDEFADAMKQFAQQPKPPDPQQQKAEADAKAAEAQQQMDQAKMQADLQRQQVDDQAKATETQSKSQDAETQRQIKMQEAADASAARNAEIEIKQRAAELTLRTDASKAAREGSKAEQDMQAAAAKHAQDLEIGALNIELLRTKIGQAHAATENAERTTEAAIAAKQASPKSDQGAGA